MNQTKYRIHLILIKVEPNIALGDDGEQHDILEEEELIGYREDFTDEVTARRVFSVYSGIDTDTSQASEVEIRVALQAYKEGILEEEVELGSGKTRARPFTNKDAEQVQTALGLRDRHASAGQIIHVARLMGLL